VIVAAFDDMGGFSLFVKDGKLKHTYSFMGVQVYKQESGVPLPEGKVRVKLDFEAEAPVVAPGGTVRLFIQDEEVGSGRMEHTVPFVFSAYAGMDIGRDNGQVVDREYLQHAPFAFTGTIEKVVFDVRPPGTAAQLQAVHQAQVAGQQARHIEA
jgi:arylsulfatase